jgi:hypothetical protein
MRMLLRPGTGALRGQCRYPPICSGSVSASAPELVLFCSSGPGDRKPAGLCSVVRSLRSAVSGLSSSPPPATYQQGAARGQQGGSRGRSLPLLAPLLSPCCPPAGEAPVPGLRRPGGPSRVFGGQGWGNLSRKNSGQPRIDADEHGWMDKWTSRLVDCWPNEPPGPSNACFGSSAGRNPRGANDLHKCAAACAAKPVWAWQRALRPV